MSKVFDQITIIGLGLIGSSVARAVRKHRLANHISGCDDSDSTLAYARSHKIIDTATRDAGIAVKGSQLIILATPPSTLSSIAQAIAPHLEQGAIVIDTASVKRHAVEAIAPHLPAHAVFIPAHPIAGSEQSGISAGNADLFQRKRVVVTPGELTASEAIQQVTAFWNGMGARVEGIPADLHDMLYAYVSHLPQLLAFAVGKMSPAPQHADAFMRLTRSSPALWMDIFTQNSDNIAKALARYLDAIVHIRNELAAAPPDAENLPDNGLVMNTLFPRIAASCLITTVMEAERKAGFSFARYAGTGFADFTSPTVQAPDAHLETISNHSAATAAALDAYIARLQPMLAYLNANDRKGLASALAA